MREILSNAQFGFRSNRKTLMQSLFYKTWLYYRLYFFFYVLSNWKQPYDWIIEIYRDLEIHIKSPPLLIYTLKALFTGTTAEVKGSKSFLNFIGCRHGSIESTVIFNIYLVLKCMEYMKWSEVPKYQIAVLIIPGHWSTLKCVVYMT